MKKRAKFLSMSEVEATIEEVSLIAKAEQVRIALVGGAAMQLYGSDRLTADVDFVADGLIPLRDVEPLTFGGVRGFASNGVPVDIIVRNDDFEDLYISACKRARKMAGVDVLVVRPEHLAAMKLAAGRPKDDSDLETLINSGELDIDASRIVIRKYLGTYAAQAFDSAVALAEWKLERSKRNG